MDYAWSRGAVIVAAAGNDGLAEEYAPANCAHVIGVGATDAADSHPSFSNYGTNVEVVAPGVDIMSTDFEGNYFSTDATGTSVSSAFVSGLAGLVWSTGWGTSNQALVDRITHHADEIAGSGVQWKYGRINAKRAVGVDLTDAPQVVNDGSQGDSNWTNVLSELSANWSPVAGAAGYEYALGTTPGGTQLSGFTDVRGSTTVTRPGLALAQEATYYVSVRAYDIAGNRSNAANSNGITVDTTPPVVSMTAPADGAVVTASDQTQLDSAARVNLGATVGTGASGISRFGYETSMDGGNAWIPAGMWSPGTPYTATTSFTCNGAYLARAYAVDGAGNSTTSSAVLFTVDASPRVSGLWPSASLATNQIPLVMRASAANFGHTDAQLQFQLRPGGGSAWEDIGPPISLQACGLSSPVITSVTGQAGARTDGNYEARIVAYEPNPRQTIAAQVTFTIDTVAPDTTFTSYPSSGTQTSAVLAFAISETGGGFSCSLDGAPFAPCGPSVIVGPLAIGDHHFSAVAFDAAGNTDSTPAVVNWTVFSPPSGGGGGSGGGGSSGVGGGVAVGGTGRRRGTASTGRTSSITFTSATRNTSSCAATNSRCWTASKR
jgi:hypothetical protein